MLFRSQGKSMKRRDFITPLGGAAAAWPLVGRAQQTAKIPRIGLLSPFTPADTAPWHRAFLRGLSDLGWVDGKNIAVEYRYSDGRNDRLPGLIADPVRLKVDIIVTAVTNDTLAAKNAASGIPIVMAACWRSSGDWDSCKLGAAWRQHYWAVPNEPRSNWQTPGAAQRNCS